MTSHKNTGAVIHVMGIVVVVDGSGGDRLAGGLVQSLIEPSVDLGDQSMPIDDIETDDDDTRTSPR